LQDFPWDQPSYFVNGLSKISSNSQGFSKISSKFEQLIDLSTSEKHHHSPLDEFVKCTGQRQKRKIKAKRSIAIIKLLKDQIRIYLL
jgi:hypothetical protein